MRTPQNVLIPNSFNARFSAETRHKQPLCREVKGMTSIPLIAFARPLRIRQLAAPVTSEMSAKGHFLRVCRLFLSFDARFAKSNPCRGRTMSVVFGRTPVIQTPKPGLRIMRDELADQEWAAIKPMLPNRPCRAARVNDRRVLSTAFSGFLRSGAPWRDLPDAFGRLHRRC
jgi:hypothetical protein